MSDPMMSYTCSYDELYKILERNVYNKGLIYIIYVIGGYRSGTILRRLPIFVS